MSEKAHWEPHGSGSRMVLRPGLSLFTFKHRADDTVFKAIVFEKYYPNRFSTQAEAEQFAVETLRGILRDVEERLP